MVKGMYAIQDEKAHSIGAVFMAASDAEAERIVVLGVKGNELMTRYPADFALLRLGNVNCETGHIVVPDVPVLVCKLDDLLSRASRAE